MIESVNNERVKYWSKLKMRKYHRMENLFLVEGEHPVAEAREAGLLVEVIVQNGFICDFENKTIVSEEVMKKISSLDNPPKIIGVAKCLNPVEIVGRVLVLDEIQDPGNLGTIIRSAVAFHIDTLVISENSVSIYNPKVQRACEGLIFKINIVVSSSLDREIDDLKRRGYRIYATDVEGGTGLKDVTFTEKIAIIVGNEGRGVSKNLKAKADEKLIIDMNPQCESLNVGIATSIILYELDRHL